MSRSEHRVDGRVGQASAVQPPRKWRQVLVNFVVVYPCVMVFTRLIAPELALIPEPLRSIIMVLGMCIILTYALPVVSRWAAPRTVR